MQDDHRVRRILDPDTVPVREAGAGIQIEDKDAVSGQDNGHRAKAACQSGQVFGVIKRVVGGRDQTDWMVQGECRDVALDESGLK